MRAICPFSGPLVRAGCRKGETTVRRRRLAIAGSRLGEQKAAQALGTWPAEVWFSPNVLVAMLEI